MFHRFSNSPARPPSRLWLQENPSAESITHCKDFIQTLENSDFWKAHCPASPKYKQTIRNSNTSLNRKIQWTTAWHCTAKHCCVCKETSSKFLRKLSRCFQLEFQRRYRGHGDRYDPFAECRIQGSIWWVWQGTLALQQQQQQYNWE